MSSHSAICGVFVTGTDTGVGKTYVSVALLQALNELGAQTAAMKPVATGAGITTTGLRNSDALQLQAAASVKSPYELVNPYVFAPPIAPHLAAAGANTRIAMDHIIDCAQTLSARSEFLLVEGVGGWRVPLNGREHVSDLARHLGLPVMLVVGLRLGCISHALLTCEAMVSDRVPILGWVANSIDPLYQTVTGTVQDLTVRIGTAPLAVLDWSPDRQAPMAAAHLRCVARNLMAALPCPDLDQPVPM